MQRFNNYYKHNVTFSKHYIANEQHTIKYPHISKLTAEECPFADTGERNAARHHAVLCPAFTSARQQTAVACQTRMRDENAGQQGRNEYLYGHDGKKY